MPLDAVHMYDLCDFCATRPESPPHRRWEDVHHTGQSFSVRTPENGPCQLETVRLGGECRTGPITPMLSCRDSACTPRAFAGKSNCTSINGGLVRES